MNSLQVVDILPTGYIGLGTNATASERLRVNGTGTFLGGLNVSGYTSMVNAGATGDIIVNGTMSANAVTATTNVTANGTVSGLAVNATNVTSTNYYYTTNRTRRVNIPPEGFRASSSNQLAYFGGGSGISYFDATVGTATMCAPVDLPAGATIVSIDMTFLDNSGPADIGFNFYRRHVNDTFYTLLSSAESFSSSASVNTITGSAITIPLVSDSYDYCVYVYSSDWQGGVMGVKNIQVRYTVPAPD